MLDFLRETEPIRLVHSYRKKCLFEGIVFCEVSYLAKLNSMHGNK